MMRGIQQISRRAVEKIGCALVYGIVRLERTGLQSIGGACPRTLATSRIDRQSKVISGGVGGDISFEMDLAAQTDCRIALFDPSPTGARTIEAMSPLPSEIKFYPVGIAANSGRRFFAEPFNRGEGSFRQPRKGERGTHEWSAISISDFLEEAGWSSVDLIKLDIEGFEYEVLRSLVRSEIRPRQLLVEFHYGPSEGHSLWEYLRTLLFLRAAGYRLIHQRYADHTFEMAVR